MPPAQAAGNAGTLVAPAHHGPPSSPAAAGAAAPPTSSQPLPHPAAGGATSQEAAGSGHAQPATHQPHQPQRSPAIAQPADSPAGRVSERYPDRRMVCQVVSLGAGMCTRPWRLEALARCRVLELDLPYVVEAKRRLLAEVDAQLTHPAGDEPPASVPHAPAMQQQQPGPGAELHERVHAQGQVPAPPQEDAAEPHAFPLLAGGYACIGLDLSACGPADLASALRAHGFDPALPTLWVLEALLYYMPLRPASALLTALAELSAPGSRLIATCVDRELLEASRSGMPKGHVFADLWHFDTDELLYNTDAFATCWQVDWRATSASDQQQDGALYAERTEQQDQQQQRQRSTILSGAVPCLEGKSADGSGQGVTSYSACQPGVDAVDCASARQCEEPGSGRRLPPSTRRLAMERLGADTYVALYGGSELLFVAGLRLGAVFPGSGARG